MRRMLRKTKTDAVYTYTSHPWVSAHYRGLLAPDDPATRQAHKGVAKHYQGTAKRPGRFPTLDDLRPYIEVIHHLCRAGAYDEAWNVLRGRILQDMINQLGAYETYLTLLLEFFPNGDTFQDPKVSNPQAQRFILNAIGFCLMNLGRLGEAPPLYERSVEGGIAAGEHHNNSVDYHNLAELYIHLGQLVQSAESAERALEQAKQVRYERYRKPCKMISLAYLAWTEHLRGEAPAAGEHFQQAEALEREIDPEAQYLYSQRGIQHANHLGRTGEADYARRVTEANLEICENQLRDPSQTSQCHHVLGDLDADAGKHEQARRHYDQALTIARGIDRRDVVVEALLARGLWQAKYMKEHQAAFNDLNEALGYCTESGYRRYEADCRVALAWTHFRAGSNDQAREEAQKAIKLSEDMSYHWGKVDAKEVLKELSESTGIC
jgi:tetratricopeptide (TPR) repeat protein